MTGSRRLRPAALLITAVTLLVAFGAGVGTVRAAERCNAGSRPVVDRPEAGAVATGTLVDPRIQPDAEVGQGRRTPHQPGPAGQPGLGRGPARWASALAAVLERAGHPERISQICLRGPPGLSA